ncbi:MAG: carboxypeptidase regulatory-like domain-containing protein, partial [Roseiflexaceae bacterium]|nr:carboxypeptidase regulatory-like domain-containing protein [Roseiflexaceae bacterium]
RRLPRTNDAADVTWLWASFGILLIGAGVGLGMLPAGRRVLATGAARIAHLNNQALLQKLLSEQPNNNSAQDDALLRKLLESQE